MMWTIEGWLELKHKVLSQYEDIVLPVSLWESPLQRLDSLMTILPLQCESQYLERRESLTSIIMGIPITKIR